MPDNDPMRPDQRLATTDQAAYELYGEQGRAEQVDRGDGSVLQAGRVFIPVALAERATQTSIEILLPADRMNGVHLPPGETHEHRDWMPALVRYTGVDPAAPITAGKRPAGVPVVITDEQIAEAEQLLGPPHYAEPPTVPGLGVSNYDHADERNAAPYPTTSQALHSAENPLDDGRLGWWSLRIYDAVEYQRYTVDLATADDDERTWDRHTGYDRDDAVMDTMKAFVTEVRGTLGGS